MASDESVTPRIAGQRTLNECIADAEPDVVPGQTPASANGPEEAKPVSPARPLVACPLCHRTDHATSRFADGVTVVACPQMRRNLIATTPAALQALKAANGVLASVEPEPEPAQGGRPLSVDEIVARKLGR